MGTEYRSFDDLPLTLRVEDLMPILGVGRNTAYELVRSRQIRSIRIGHKILYPEGQGQVIERAVLSSQDNHAF